MKFGEHFGSRLNSVHFAMDFGRTVISLVEHMAMMYV